MVTQPPKERGEAPVIDSAEAVEVHGLHAVPLAALHWVDMQPRDLPNLRRSSTDIRVNHFFGVARESELVQPAGSREVPAQGRLARVRRKVEQAAGCQLASRHGVLRS